MYVVYDCRELTMAYQKCNNLRYKPFCQLARLDTNKSFDCVKARTVYEFILHVSMSDCVPFTYFLWHIGNKKAY